MSIRVSVRRLADFGKFPDEDRATEEELKQIESLLRAISRPLSDDEALVLLKCFGNDECFEMAWTLLHLIETAPHAMVADYSQMSDNMWRTELMERQQRA